MTQQPQSGSPVLTLKQFPPEPAPKRRTPAEKARILAHLALQLAALEIDERRGNGNA